MQNGGSPMSEVSTVLAAGKNRRRSSLRLWTPMRTREALAGYLFLLPFAIFFGVFVVKGVLFAIQMSFYDWNVLAPVHKFVGLNNYLTLLNDPLWWVALTNTLAFAV